MEVEGTITIQRADPTDVPQLSSGLQIMRADGMPFATFKPMAGGQWSVMRNGGSVCTVTIGTSNYLLEAKLPNGKRVAAIKREQVKVENNEMMLELCVEPETD